MSDKVTAPLLRRKKEHGEKIVMATCYDYPTALLMDQAGVDSILVGDSVGDNVLGYENTLPVTLDVMIHHTRAVRRGTARALLVADMPFLTYQVTPEEALRNAGRLVQEGGAEAVKLEGGQPVLAAVARIVAAGIPVVGHLGLTPQSVNQFGGYRTQGRGAEAADQIVADAKALEEAGVCAMVIELVPPPLAARVSEAVRVPTIGIGAGPYCDGQVQVLHDLIGLYPDRIFRHNKRYAEVGASIREALTQYAADVRAGRFPVSENTH